MPSGYLLKNNYSGENLKCEICGQVIKSGDNYFSNKVNRPYKNNICNQHTGPKKKYVICVKCK